MKIALSIDHAGGPLKEAVAAAIVAAGHSVSDLGMCDDYPDSAVAAGRAVLTGVADRAIIICGSSAGVAVAACKLRGIRAATGHDTYTAAQCVTHDNCHVLCLGARVIGPAVATECVTAFCNAQFSNEERHVRRLAKIDEIERNPT
jgi:ribose 5-phosphate isomerase B